MLKIFPVARRSRSRERERERRGEKRSRSKSRERDYYGREKKGGSSRNICRAVRSPSPKRRSGGRWERDEYPDYRDKLEEEMRLKQEKLERERQERKVAVSTLRT